jgi:hypothetical protein
MNEKTLVAMADSFSDNRKSKIENQKWLNEAGFVHIERAAFLLPDGDGIMTVRKPR